MRRLRTVLGARPVENDPADLALRYTFTPGVLDPATFFTSAAKATAGLIHLETALLYPLDGLESRLLLQRIQEASLRALLRRETWLQGVQQLRSAVVSNVVGRLLAEQTQRVVAWWAEHPHVEDRLQVVPLTKQLDAAYAEIEPVALQARRRLKTFEILRSTQEIAKSRTTKDQQITLEEQGYELEIPEPIDFGERTLEELLAVKVEKSESEDRLTVKKPEYITPAKWQFRQRGDGDVMASIEDHEWLGKFQRAEIPVPPGSSLRALVRREVLRDEAGEQTQVKVTVLEVREVLPPDAPGQPDLFIKNDE